MHHSNSQGVPRHHHRHYHRHHMTVDMLHVTVEGADFHMLTVCDGIEGTAGLRLPQRRHVILHMFRSAEAAYTSEGRVNKMSLRTTTLASGRTRDILSPRTVPSLPHIHSPI